MTEELANTLTWAAFCAFCVVAVALILDAVSELLRSETPEKSARRRAGKIVRRANLDLFVWRVKQSPRRFCQLISREARQLTARGKGLRLLSEEFNAFLNRPVHISGTGLLRKANRDLNNRQRLKTVKFWNL